jgi:hypothetical protein
MKTTYTASTLGLALLGSALLIDTPGDNATPDIVEEILATLLGHDYEEGAIIDNFYVI